MPAESGAASCTYQLAKEVLKVSISYCLYSHLIRKRNHITSRLIPLPNPRAEPSLGLNYKSLRSEFIIKVQHEWFHHSSLQCSKELKYQLFWLFHADSSCSSQPTQEGIKNPQSLTEQLLCKDCCHFYCLNVQHNHPTCFERIAKIKSTCSPGLRYYFGFH